MATSTARAIMEEPKSSTLGPVFYQKADNGSYRPYDWDYDTAKSASDADTTSDAATFDMDSPTPQGDSLSGLIRQIDHLINSRQSIAAINLTMDVLSKYGSELSDFAYERLVNKIEDALPYVRWDGSVAEAEELRRRVIRDLNLASHFDEKLIASMGAAGFANLVLSMRSANATTFEGGTKDTPGFAPNLSLAGGT